VAGVLEAGVPGSALVQGSLRSALEHQIPHERLSPAQVAARFPAFDLPGDWDCLHQPDGGVLEPEKAIRLHVAAARAMGAVLRTNTRVTRVEPSGDHVRVALASGEAVDAGAAIIAAGPWIGELAPDMTAHLTLTRQAQIWFDPVRPDLATPGRMPVFLLDTGEDVVYGVPALGGSGVKAGSHRSGGAVANADAPRAEVSPAETRAIDRALRRHVPGAAGPVSRTSACVYTRTVDEHFVVGPHPRWPRIVLASPCSGHGFKFASVLGEILADLATTGATEAPIGLFTPGRLLG
jgi:sarcosine oxidase